MAAKERSGPAKRRSWGKCRQKEKVLCIDHMDVAELTSTNKSTFDRSRSEDLQHPELMSNQTIVDYLSEMKIVIKDRELSRERLFYLFRKHVSPKPQRSSFWRRRRGVKDAVPMVVDYNHETWISSSKSWDSPLLRKRKHDEDESDVPATKRPEEVCYLIANTSLNDSVTDSVSIKTNTVATTKKVIKIRRKHANHKSEPVTTSVSSEKMEVQCSSSEGCH